QNIVRKSEAGFEQAPISIAGDALLCAVEAFLAILVGDFTERTGEGCDNNPVRCSLNPAYNAVAVFGNIYRTIGSDRYAIREREGRRYPKLVSGIVIALLAGAGECTGLAGPHVERPDRVILLIGDVKQAVRSEGQPPRTNESRAIGTYTIS